MDRRVRGVTRVLVLGANGMLGHRVLLGLSGAVETWGTVRSDAVLSRLPGWLPTSRIVPGVAAGSFDTVSDALRSVRPDAVVNCIGIIKQRPQAGDPVQSIEVNALFPHRLGELCAQVEARLIHISTDSVFSGAGGGYRETDPPDPDDLYGRTKLLGEVDREGCVTLRTSMVGWELSGHRSLLEWLAGRRPGRVDGYRKVVFSGLTTPVLADLIRTIIERSQPVEGLFNAPADPIAKFDLIRRVVDVLGWPVDVRPVDSPVLDKSLDGTKLRDALGWRAPEWDAMIGDLASERSRYE